MANTQDENDRGQEASDRANGGKRSNRGFASMDPSKQKEIASKGGRAAHAKGTAHEFDSGEAREAGRKGGMAVSRNREHMAAIGRKGGEARGAKNAQRSQGAQGAVRGAQQNSGAALGALRSDRQVSIPGAAQNSGAGDSAFGERRPAGSDHQREQRPDNH